MRELLRRFAELVATGRIEIYNEISLQHELGFFLREHLPAYQVQFERNVSHFFPGKTQFTKREIDISVYSAEQQELYCALELKYPQNGQYPEQMFSFIKDIAFAEELNGAGFQEAWVIIFAKDRLFYEGSTNGIYAHFRDGKELHGVVGKPTGSRNEEVHIQGRYRVQWQSVVEKLRYACIEAAINPVPRAPY